MADCGSADVTADGSRCFQDGSGDSWAEYSYSVVDNGQGGVEPNCATYKAHRTMATWGASECSEGYTGSDCTTCDTGYIGDGTNNMCWECPKDLDGVVYNA